MKTFYSLKRLLIIPALAVIFITGSAFADNYFEISKNLEIFTAIYKELNIYYVDETKPGKLMKTGIDAMLKSLDPYTVYYPESKIEDYRFMTTGQYGGIGAMVESIDDDIVITEPHEGFAAHKAGLKAGDIIKKIDDRDIVDLKYEELSELLKGQSGTSLVITVKRPGTAEPMDFQVDREEVKVPDVPFYSMVDDKTGYIKLTGFTRTASTEVRTAFKDLKDNEGMSQLILDLRGNGGGLLRESVNIVNFFVPKGEEIVSTRGKLEDWNKTHLALNEPLDKDMPLIVLIDGRSASASEIVSGALQDFDRAVVVGNLSFGKGLVQQTKDVSYNSKLKLTVAKYYIPSGRCIQKLDYSHRDKDGDVGEVPDSLITPFTTLGGRPVFDGRGVSPDVEVELDPVSHILMGLIKSHVDFHYATDYALKVDSIEDPTTFRISDADYEAFTQFALTKEFDYSTDTERLLKKLKEAADAEKYLDGSEAEFDALFAQITPEKAKDLVKFKAQIKAHLEQEIVSRYAYQTGRIRNFLDSDVVMDKAIEIFSSDYQDILTNN